MEETKQKTYFWNRFTELCNKNNTKPNPVGKKLNIASGTISKWKNGSNPHDTTKKRIADYFGVSVDYFEEEPEGQKENRPAAVSDEAIKVALFGGDTEVSDEMWNEVMNYAEYLKQKYGKN